MKTFAVCVSTPCSDGRHVHIDFVTAKSKKAAMKAATFWDDDIVVAVEVLTRAKFNALKDGYSEAEIWCSQIYWAEGPEPVGCPKMRVIRESARNAMFIIGDLLYDIGDNPLLCD